MSITFIEKGSLRRGQTVFEIKRTDSFNDESDASHTAPRIGTAQVSKNGYWAIFSGRSFDKRSELASGKEESFEKAIDKAEQQAEEIIG